MTDLYDNLIPIELINETVHIVPQFEKINKFLLCKYICNSLIVNKKIYNF